MKKCEECTAYTPTYDGWGHCIELNGHVNGESGQFCPIFESKTNEIIRKPRKIETCPWCNKPALNCICYGE